MHSHSSPHIIDIFINLKLIFFNVLKYFVRIIFNLNLSKATILYTTSGVFKLMILFYLMNNFSDLLIKLFYKWNFISYHRVLRLTDMICVAFATHFEKHISKIGDNSAQLLVATFENISPSNEFSDIILQTVSTV